METLRGRVRSEAPVIEHYVSVRAFVRSLGVDADWVDDLAQEVFLTAYGLWISFAEARDFGRWVRGIAANLFLNEIREDSRRRRILQRELTDILLSRIAGSKPTRNIFPSLRPVGGWMRLLPRVGLSFSAGTATGSRCRGVPSSSRPLRRM
jgi:hypothetical protein